MSRRCQKSLPFISTLRLLPVSGLLSGLTLSYTSDLLYALLDSPLLDLPVSISPSPLPLGSFIVQIPSFLSNKFYNMKPDQSKR
ncbi:hypothetical protein TNCT_504311 [Trichonephila clavata]|uniref:Uncharacterized protein n=1 Tax=Trichonephila clavata TaxID=2740835 RepID=A0A8X6FYZ2_TRICU|nr:hypothetical protein TNCT_504311 [Trichonephila clavata]